MTHGDPIEPIPDIQEVAKSIEDELPRVSGGGFTDEVNLRWSRDWVNPEHPEESWGEFDYETESR